MKINENNKGVKMSKIYPYTKEIQTASNIKKKESTFGKKPSRGSFGKKKYSWNRKGSKKKAKVRKCDIIDNKYTKWLGTQPCVITGIVAERGVGPYNIHCHHIHGRSLGRNDYMQVPLIGFLHSWGDKAYHNNTKKDFCKKNGIMVDDIVKFFEEKARYYVEKYKENGGIIQEND